MTPPSPLHGRRGITFTVNGEPKSVLVYPMERLLDVLRRDLCLTGSKEGCGEGECGSCSVLIDGVLVNSCLIPVLQAEGTHILTIEGLANEVLEKEIAVPQVCARSVGANLGSNGCRVQSPQTIGEPRKDSPLHPVQQAFLECGGAQCGICTPGMILATVELLRKKPNPTDKEIREGLSGNLCRCTGYLQIFRAVEEASRRIAPGIREE